MKMKFETPRYLYDKTINNFIQHGIYFRTMVFDFVNFELPDTIFFQDYNWNQAVLFFSVIPCPIAFITSYATIERINLD